MISQFGHEIIGILPEAPIPVLPTANTMYLYRNTVTNRWQVDNTVDPLGIDYGQPFFRNLVSNSVDF
jgi:hypothetical protein